jgi:hypothetical protein
MARPGLIDHTKFKRLVFILKEPVPHVWGYLECIWLVGYSHGNPHLGDEIDVELAAQFPGEPGKLCQALVKCGFINRIADGKYEIHDLLDNAPDYVRKRATRRLQKESEDAASAERRTMAKSDCLQHSTEQNKIPPTPLRGDDEEINAGPGRRGEDTDRSGPCTPDGLPAEPSPTEFLEAWNAVADFSRCLQLTGKRERRFSQRARDPEWVKNWRVALKKASESPFCRGKNRNGWRATVDWFLRPLTVTKIQEGALARDGERIAKLGAEAADRASRLKAQRAQAEADKARAAGKETWQKLQEKT